MNSRLPTMQDVAREAGVGKSTVSLALRDDPRLRPATRQRIQRIAETLGYKANATVANLMAQLRASRTPKYQATLGLLNFSHNPDYLRTVPTFHQWVLGCRERAKQLGYTLDEFWVHDKEIPPEKLVRILDSRGIRGLIFVAIDETGDLVPPLNSLWEKFSSVILGVCTTRPALHFCCNDHYSTSMSAVEEVLRRGYKRPGLVMDVRVDKLVEFRFTAGYLIGQNVLPAKQRLPVCDLPDRTPDAFLKWFHKYKPDVIITLHDETLEWLEGAGQRIPEDVALVHLDWYPAMKRWAGLEQSNHMVGSAALDILVSQLHRNETGAPPMTKCLQIESRWMEGPSVRPAPAIA